MSRIPVRRIPVREHEHEPMPGIPEMLPDSEYILWQGRPSARLLARRVLKTGWIAGYFAVLGGWALVAGWNDERTIGSIAFSAGVLAVMGALVVGMLELYAWAIERMTLYTVTNSRVILRIGVGLTVTVNLPFARIVSASVNCEKDGSGNIAFEMEKDTRLAWFIVWPHCRAWRLAHPEPAMICLPDVRCVAELVARELSLLANADEGEVELKPAAVAATVRSRKFPAEAEGALAGL